jgi:hypothetical protein
VTTEPVQETNVTVTEGGAAPVVIDIKEAEEQPHGSDQAVLATQVPAGVETQALPQSGTPLEVAVTEPPAGSGQTLQDENLVRSIASEEASGSELIETEKSAPLSPSSVSKEIAAYEIDGTLGPRPEEAPAKEKDEPQLLDVIEQAVRAAACPKQAPGAEKGTKQALDSYLQQRDDAGKAPDPSEAVMAMLAAGKEAECPPKADENAKSAATAPAPLEKKPSNGDAAQ